MKNFVPVALFSLALFSACSEDDEMRTYQPEVSVSYVTVGDIELAYFEEGSGPLVVLLHGFPDTPHTFDDIRPLLANAGYRAVSPFTRGYAPSQIPAEDAYDVESLGRDVLNLITALGEEKAIVIGHDWGAMAAYAAAALEPDKVTQLVTIAIPHPAGQILDEEFFERASHFLYLAGDGALALMQENDFAHVDELYARWSPTWQVPPEETEAVKNVFTAPGSLNGALGYYRAVSPQPPAFFASPITVPTLSFAGVDDGVTLPEAFDAAAVAFSGPYTVERVAGGHFLHRESPVQFADPLLAFLQ